MRRFAFLLAVPAFLAAPAAPASPVVRSAVLTCGVDDIADFWLNGVHLATVPYTPREKGQAEVELKDLCLFRRTNVLALRAADENPTEVGVAYLLRIELSDRRWLILSSSEENLHRAFWVEEPAAPDPYGWFHPSFDDRRWTPAYNLGLHFPNMSSVEDRKAKRDARFMSASGVSTKVGKKGERHLFRRTFMLDVTVRPDCITPSPTPSWTPSGTPTPTFYLPPSPSSPKATYTPTAFRTYTPTRTATLVRVRAKKVPSWTSTPTFYFPPSPSAPKATHTPTAFRTFTPTATARIVPRRPTVPPLPTFTPSAAIPPVTVVPGAGGRVPEILRGPSQESVTFVRPPLIFFVSFVEPGDYRIAVYGQDGAETRVLLEETVRAPREQWVEWDGKDAAGVKAGAGSYTVIMTRDGRPMRKTAAVLQRP